MVRASHTSCGFRDFKGDDNVGTFQDHDRARVDHGARGRCQWHGGEMRPLGINMGYAIDMKGNVKIIDLPAAMVKKMMSKATTVKRNVVIFMQDGKLMMADWPTGQ